MPPSVDVVTTKNVPRNRTRCSPCWPDRAVASGLDDDRVTVTERQRQRRARGDRLRHGDREVDLGWSGRVGSATDVHPDRDDPQTVVLVVQHAVKAREGLGGEWWPRCRVPAQLP